MYFQHQIFQDCKMTTSPNFEIFDDVVHSFSESDNLVTKNFFPLNYGLLKKSML